MWRCTCTHTALKTDVRTLVLPSLSFALFWRCTCTNLFTMDLSRIVLPSLHFAVAFAFAPLQGRCLAQPQVLPHGNRVGGDKFRDGLPARLGQSAAAGEEGRLLPPEVHPCCGGHTAGKPRRLASAEPTRLLLQLICCDSCVVTRVLLRSGGHDDVSAGGGQRPTGDGLRSLLRHRLGRSPDRPGDVRPHPSRLPCCRGRPGLSDPSRDSTLSVHTASLCVASV